MPAVSSHLDYFLHPIVVVMESCRSRHSLLEAVDSGFGSDFHLWVMNERTMEKMLAVLATEIDSVKGAHSLSEFVEKLDWLRRGADRWLHRHLAGKRRSWAVLHLVHCDAECRLLNCDSSVDMPEKTLCLRDGRAIGMVEERAGVGAAESPLLKFGKWDTRETRLSA